MFIPLKNGMYRYWSIAISPHRCFTSPFSALASAAGRQASLGVPTTPCVPHRRPVPPSAVRSPASGSRANNVDFLKVICMNIYMNIYIYITIYLYVYTRCIYNIYCVYIIIYIRCICNYMHIYCICTVTVYVCIYCICSVYIVYVLYTCILTINYISGKNLQSGWWFRPCF